MLVEGVNKVKKAIKKQGPTTPGYFVEVERPIHVSNVAVIDPTTNKPSRIGFILE